MHDGLLYLVCGGIGLPRRGRLSSFLVVLRRLGIGGHNVIFSPHPESTNTVQFGGILPETQELGLGVLDELEVMTLAEILGRGKSRLLYLRT